MKIGLDLRMLGTTNGGIGRYAFEIAKHILQIDRDNKYTLFFNKKTADSADLEFFENFYNATLVSTGSRHYSLAEQSSFLYTLNKHRLDLTHFPNFNVPYFYKRPFVVTIHDMVHHKISGAKKSRLPHFYAYKKVIEHAAYASASVITVSEYSKKDIVRHLGIQPEKITVVYEGTTLRTNVSDEEVLDIKDRFLLKRPYFLFVGVLERKKNIVNLTRGFDEFLKAHGLDMDLVIVGKTDKHYPDIKHKALDITNKDRLVFTGYVEDSELAALYRGAHAYVSASLHEGFGLPGVEAMRSGLPLAVSNLEVFNEIYDNAAVYFDPLNPKDIGEKMYLLVRDTEFYAQLQNNGLKRGKMFDWRAAAEQTLGVYQKCLAKTNIEREIKHLE